MTTFWKMILAPAFLLAGIAGPMAFAQPPSLDVKGAPIPIQILAQSQADTTTDLQVICLFRSSPVNALHGSLSEMDEKLKGLLERIRKPELFRGELGETLVLAPPKESLGAKKLLIIGLGDSQTFSPQRMQLVGEILYAEASRMGVAHPFFAPTILDGGVAGFLRAATDKVFADANASASHGVTALTFLARPQNVNSTRKGIEKLSLRLRGSSRRK